MITLPDDQDQTWPLIRILVMPQGKWTSGQTWEVLPQPNRVSVPDSSPNGYELEFCDRVALPEVGQAQFLFHYGDISGDTYTPRDLIGYHVRIQGADEPDDDQATPMWRTIYLGTVESQTDNPWPSTYAAGNRTYYCSDLLYRTSKWPLCHHHMYQAGLANFYVHCFGHPGYNYAINGYFRRLLGNMDTSGSTVDPFGDNPKGYKAHTWAGAATSKTWADVDVLEHALWSSRAAGEPIFTIKNPGNLPADAFPWQVGDGEKCWDLLCRVLSRQRGRGIAFLDWDDDSSDPLAAISPYINVQPQNYNDITYTKPAAGGSVTVVGGSSSAIAVDLTGDHRYVDGSLTLTVNNSTGVDYLETQGEPIECLVTLSGQDSTLDQRWTDADAAAFAAISPANFWQRMNTRWRTVFQRWGIPIGWDFKAGDGNGGAKSSCFYITNAAGAIVQQTVGGTFPSPSPLTCKIGCDIPIYEGWNYATSTPVRYDGASDYLAPPRNPCLILIKQGSNLYVNGGEYLGVGMQVDDFGVFVQYGPDQQAGTRLFAGPLSPVATNDQYTPPGGFSKNDLVISVGLTFGHHVRMSSANINPATGSAYTELDAGRKLYVRLNGAHLWLAHPGAIWEHDSLIATDKAMPAKRAAAGGAGAVPGIIRDDRDSLALTHALAWAWYGTKRTSAQWSLRCCGLLPSFEVADTDPVDYPTLGQIVQSIQASGTANPVLTPVSRIHYDHTAGRTSWFTDWQDLDTSAL